MDCSWVKSLAKRRPSQQPPFYDNKKGTFDTERICLGLGIDEIHFAKLLEYVSHLIGQNPGRSRSLTRDIRRRLRKNLDPILHNLPAAWAAKCIDQLICKASYNMSSAKRHERGRAQEPRQEIQQNQDSRFSIRASSKIRVEPSHDAPIGTRQAPNPPGWPLLGYQTGFSSPRDPTQFPRRLLAPNTVRDAGPRRNSEGVTEDAIRPLRVSVKREFDPEDSIISRPMKGYIVSRAPPESNHQAPRATVDRYIPEFEADRFAIRNSFPPDGLRVLEGRSLNERTLERRVPEERANEDRARERRFPEERALERRLLEARPPERRAPETRAPERRAPEIRAPERRLHDRWVPDRWAPDRWAPDVRAPERRAPEGRAPERRAPEGRAPDRRAPEGKAAEKRVPAERAQESQASDKRISKMRSLTEQSPESPAPVNRVAKIQAPAESSPKIQALEEPDQERLAIVEQEPEQGKQSKHLSGEQEEKSILLKERTLGEHVSEEPAQDNLCSTAQVSGGIDSEDIPSENHTSNEIVLQDQVIEVRISEQQEFEKVNIGEKDSQEINEELPTPHQLVLGRQTPEECKKDVIAENFMRDGSHDIIHQSLEEVRTEDAIRPNIQSLENMIMNNVPITEGLCLTSQTNKKVSTNDMAFMARRESGDWVLLGTGNDLMGSTGLPDWDVFLSRLKVGLEFSLQAERLYCSWLSLTNGEELVGIFDAFGWKAGIANMYRRGLSEFRFEVKKHAITPAIGHQQQEEKAEAAGDREEDTDGEKEGDEEIVRSSSLSSLDSYNDQ